MIPAQILTKNITENAPLSEKIADFTLIPARYLFKGKQIYYVKTPEKINMSYIESISYSHSTLKTIMMIIFVVPCTLIGSTFKSYANWIHHSKKEIALLKEGYLKDHNALLIHEEGQKVKEYAFPRFLSHHILTIISQIETKNCKNLNAIAMGTKRFIEEKEKREEKEKIAAQKLQKSREIEKQRKEIELQAKEKEKYTKQKTKLNTSKTNLSVEKKETKNEKHKEILKEFQNRGINTDEKSHLLASIVGPNHYLFDYYEIRVVDNKLKFASSDQDLNYTLNNESAWDLEEEIRNDRKACNLGVPERLIKENPYPSEEKQKLKDILSDWHNQNEENQKKFIRYLIIKNNLNKYGILDTHITINQIDVAHFRGNISIRNLSYNVVFDAYTYEMCLENPIKQCVHQGRSQGFDISNEFPDELRLHGKEMLKQIKILSEFENLNENDQEILRNLNNLKTITDKEFIETKEFLLNKNEWDKFGVKAEDLKIYTEDISTVPLIMGTVTVKDKTFNVFIDKQNLAIQTISEKEKKRNSIEVTQQELANYSKLSNEDKKIISDLLNWNNIVKIEEIAEVKKHLLKKNNWDKYVQYSQLKIRTPLPGQHFTTGTLSLNNKNKVEESKIPTLNIEINLKTLDMKIELEGILLFGNEKERKKYDLDKLIHYANNGWLTKQL